MELKLVGKFTNISTIFSDKFKGSWSESTPWVNRPTEANKLLSVLAVSHSASPIAIQAKCYDDLPWAYKQWSRASLKIDIRPVGGCVRRVVVGVEPYHPGTPRHPTPPPPRHPSRPAATLLSLTDNF